MTTYSPVLSSTFDCDADNYKWIKREDDTFVLIGPRPDFIEVV